jgi:hypothetical protein
MPSLERETYALHTVAKRSRIYGPVSPLLTLNTLEKHIMYQSINLYEFREAFRTMDRMENFSHAGLKVLFDYLEDYEDSTGESVELDVIALCCDYDEETVQGIADAYSVDMLDTYGEPLDPEDDDAKRECIRSYLEENTSIVGKTPTGFVYARF